jgi:integrase/recombinase XerD
MKPLTKAVRDYLTMRRGLGFKLVRHETVLREFLLFLEQKRSAAITVKLALEWATRHENQKPYEWAARLSIVRGFTRHWSATDASTEIPPIGLCRFNRRELGPISTRSWRSRNY